MNQQQKIEVEEILVTHTGLHFDETTLKLTGYILVDNDDKFYIEVEILRWIKLQKFPVVYEVGERIPKKADRHIYTDSGSCCLTTTLMEEVLLSTKINTLGLFFSEILIPYFLRQIYYEIHGEFDQEYAHGPLGILQSYQEVLHITDQNAIVTLMNERISGRRRGRNDNCYCERGKLKRCVNHFSAYNIFWDVPLSVIRNDLPKISKVNELLSKISKLQNY